MATFTVHSIILLVIITFLNSCEYCEMSIYAGLRRRPITLNDALQQKLDHQYDVPSDYLTQLMEENARRRLQQQFEQQLALINRQMLRQREQQRQRQHYQQLQAMREQQEAEDQDQDYYENNNDNNNKNNNNENNLQYDQYDNSNPDFSYKYTTNKLNDNEKSDRIPFAVGPADPRFYEEDNRDDDENLDSQISEEYEEYSPTGSRETISTMTIQPNVTEILGNIVEPTQIPVMSSYPLESSKIADSPAAATMFHRIKPQSSAAATAAMAVATSDFGPYPMKPVQNVANSASSTRHDISALIEKLQKQGKSEVVLNTHHAASSGHDSNVVMRQHLGMDGEMGVYVAALIAGVSAAITVGLIALGVAWYTLRSRSKAAADVEYPAYGVTGPNKDISPSGDRKLAQSAQMYHYQHQKQQIIAMENRQAVEGNCGLSDVDSDDDNDEGDYTVYECPGLAPTCEMEVKNPLFLDETPVTPSSIAGTPTTTATKTTTSVNLQTTLNQSPITRRMSGKGVSTSVISSSNEKNKKNKK